MDFLEFHQHIGILCALAPFEMSPFAKLWKGFLVSTL